MKKPRTLAESLEAWLQQISSGAFFDRLDEKVDQVVFHPTVDKVEAWVSSSVNRILEGLSQIESTVCQSSFEACQRIWKQSKPARDIVIRVNNCCAGVFMGGLLLVDRGMENLRTRLKMNEDDQD
ncbi:MAG TPA: hypothetical protein VIT68_03515 [Candidatus Gracilibacteria bacterium]